MAIRTELSLRIANSPGTLGAVCDALGEARVNLLALHLESSGRLRLLVDNPLLAASTLRAKDHEVEEKDVLLVSMSNSPGALGGLAKGLASAGINVEYVYAGAVEGSSMAIAVFGVADAQRAATAVGF